MPMGSHLCVCVSDGRHIEFNVIFKWQWDRALHEIQEVKEFEACEQL